MDPRVLARASNVHLSALRPRLPGCSLIHRVAIHRATTWSRATATRAGDWAHEARKHRASVDIGFRAVERDRRVAAMVLAGGIAYRVFFWMLALSIVLGALLGGLFDPTDVESTLKEHGIGAWAAAAVASAAHSAEGSEWWLLLVGGWLVLWTGYTCTKALVLAHAAIWQLQPPKVTRPVRASLVFNGFTLGFIAAVAASRWIREDHSSTGFAATLLVIVVPFGFWLAASRALPNRASVWFELVPGAVVVAAGLQAMHLFTTYFLGPKLTSATQLYGVIGVTTTILFWFYLAGRLIIAGATLNTAFTERRALDHDAAS